MDKASLVPKEWSLWQRAGVVFALSLIISFFVAEKVGLLYESLPWVNTAGFFGFGGGGGVLTAISGFLFVYPFLLSLFGALLLPNYKSVAALFFISIAPILLFILADPPSFLAFLTSMLIVAIPGWIMGQLAFYIRKKFL